MSCSHRPPDPGELLPFDESWQTETVVGLSRGIAAEVALDRLPILADALEEAGCDNLALLQHLRSDGQHQENCWALRRVLRKTVVLPGGVNLELAWCPPGRFVMGDAQSEYDAEKPAHEVRLTKGFWMGVTPVTQAQWEAVLGNNPSYFKGPQLPVEQVSWEDAVEYCDRLSELLEAKESGWRYRLPTEAEWEYACRAGTTTVYHSGDGEAALREVGWFAGNSGDSTRPVGELVANAWGLYDLHGNVWEWCEDWYSFTAYQRGDCTDPSGPSSGSVRVDRGGSWYYSAEYCRAANRYGDTPTSTSSNLGVRLARVPSGRE